MKNGTRIIVADDDPILRELAEIKLLEAGYAVETCQTGTGALLALQKHGADLVIADIEMPGMNGFELTRSIRKDSLLGQTPVIIITSGTGDKAVNDAFAAGASSFLPKPVNWSLFIHSIRFVLRASRNHKALVLARDRARAGERFKDNLMSVMSHELGTPLNAILGFGQLLDEHFQKNNDTLCREYTEYILESGNRLLNSVSDMLLSCDARTDSITLDETDVKVRCIVDEALAALEKSIRISGTGILYRLENPEQEILCDRSLLARAVAKLVDNAGKFTGDKGHITIGTLTTGSGRLALFVRDNGPGMPERKVKLAMELFSQLDMSTQRSHEGLGLGLPLANAIARAHRGTLKLRSEKGRGTQAVILLPSDRVCSSRKAPDRKKTGTPEKVMPES